MQITTISKLNKQRGAEGLTSARFPAWHANLLVSYPQVLDVDFGYVRNVRQLLFLPQKRRSARAPRAVRIEGGNKLGRWQEIYSGELDCSGSSNKWRKVTLTNAIKQRYLRIHILLNCGDPIYLTLRGLRFQ